MIESVQVSPLSDTAMVVNISNIARNAAGFDRDGHVASGHSRRNLEVDLIEPRKARDARGRVTTAAACFPHRP